MYIYQLLVGLIVGGAAAIAFGARSREEEKLLYGSVKPGRRTCLIEPLLLPAVLVLEALLLLIVAGTGTLKFSAARFGLIFLQISVYYTLLLIALPLLRRLISAMACATLWLVPTTLYFLVGFTGNELEPLFVVTLPRRFLPVLGLVWVCGFAAVLGWQMVSHLRFRRRLLAGAEDCRDAAMLDRWRSGLRKHGIKRDIPIVISDLVNTPLTIGCFERTMRLVLPERGYTGTELELIFSHELRHILRCDTRTKLFTGFCTAMCWFNPLVWLARRRASDDLELSCDESILAGAGEDVLRQYAELLLKSASCGQGYTTCLSSAAGTLRYRLRSVLKPRKRLAGGFVVGAALFALIVTTGAAALVDAPDTAQSLIFDKSPKNVTIDSVSVDNWSGEAYGYRGVYGYDEPALTEYLSSLRLRQVYSGNYREDTMQRLYVDYAETKAGELVSLTRLELCGELLFANLPYDDTGTITYIMDGEPDREYIRSLLDFDAENPDPDPQPPDMLYDIISEEPDDVTGRFTAAKKVTSFTDAQGTWAAYYSKNKTGFRLTDGSEQTQMVYSFSESAGGSYGVKAVEARLYFTYEPSDYTVTVETWDRSESYTLNGSELENGVLPLAPYSAHYTVRGGFDTVRNTHYEMEFYFDIGQPSDAEQWDVY